MVEYVFAAGDDFVAPPQDSFKICGRDQVGERPDGGRLDPALDQGGDGSVNLILANVMVFGARARERASAANTSDPAHQVLIGRRPRGTFWEAAPFEPLRRATEGRNGDGLEIDTACAASFQIIATFRCRPFGLRWSVPSRTALMKASIVASLTSSGLIPWRWRSAPNATGQCGPAVR